MSIKKSFIQFIKVIILSSIFCSQGNALESINIEVNDIITKGWLLSDIKLSLFDFQNPSQQLRLSIKKITLAEPFSTINLIDVQCTEFNWQENLIVCQTGKARFKSKKNHTQSFDFSFTLSDQKSQFIIKNLKIEKGILSLLATEKKGDWSLSIKAKNIPLSNLANYLPKQKKAFYDISKGNVSASVNLNGNRKGARFISIKSLFKDLTIQANHGKFATESIDLAWGLQAKLQQGDWQWKSMSQLSHGELYIEPVYLNIKDKKLTLKATGKYLPKGQILFQHINIIYPDIISIKANALINYKPELSVKDADIFTEITNLDQFYTLYVSPFFEGTAVEGFSLLGKANINAHIAEAKINNVSFDIKRLNILDNKKRFEVKNAQGLVNWSDNVLSETTSEISWEQLKVRAIPIESGYLRFLFKNKQLTLLKKSTIPLLGGSLYINKFNWQNSKSGEPHVYFEGGVKQLSLEKLSYALDWVPLSGNVSGYIPAVNYKHKTLTVKGELQAQLFDGIIKINNLSSSGLFTDFSKISMDMVIENLDLNLLTQKFKMGGMEGRVSGFINGLYLENWEPIAFYAWLGTPSNDDSTHRISQKAVENIASIGGSGVADIFSKGFLRFFDTFYYDQIGFGCYLHKGVCQLMGVEAADQGYYIIKGGGIPRIDIIGYNTQVDWNVLMQRLSRLSSTDEVIVK